VQDVHNIFLKKRRFWDDGQPIVPLNREAGSALREAFSRRVLGGASSAFVGYWNDQYFHGVFPPATLSSSDAVKRYVAADRNAIGYIWDSEVDDSVRVVLRLD
jgi:ABC-type phosphate transport system substrate-binding protein